MLSSKFEGNLHSILRTQTKTPKQSSPKLWCGILFHFLQFVLGKKAIFLFLQGEEQSPYSQLFHQL